MYAIQFIDETVASMEEELPYSKTVNGAIDIFCDTYGSFNDDNTFEYKDKSNAKQFYELMVKIDDTEKNLIDKKYTVAELLQNVGQIVINQHWRDLNESEERNPPTTN